MTQGAKPQTNLATTPELSAAKFVRPEPTQTPKAEPANAAALDLQLSLLGTKLKLNPRQSTGGSPRSSTGLLGSNLFQQRRGGIASPRSLIDRVVDIVVRIVKFLEQKLFGRPEQKVQPALKKVIVVKPEVEMTKKVTKDLPKEKQVTATPLRHSNR